MTTFDKSAWAEIREGKSILREPHEQQLEDPAELVDDEFVGCQFPAFLTGYKSGARNDRFFTFQVPAKYAYLTDELITEVKRKTILSVDIQKWRVFLRDVGVDPGQAEGYLPDGV